MHALGVWIVIIILSAWFLYSLYRLWRSARGGDCADCSLGSGFDYKRFHQGARRGKSTEMVTETGHHIIVDEEAARRRRQRGKN